jgi:16S rRNA (cytosine967-C5)-methyltransferase
MNPSPFPRQSPDRDLAARLLLSWIREETVPQDQPQWQEASGFSRELVWSCCRHRALLDGWIDHLSTTPPGKRIRPFLWIGLTQIFLLDGVPEHAAVHETIETAKRLRVAAGQQRYLNAVLRNALRRKEGLLEWRDVQLPEIRYSHPSFCIERWTTFFGEERTQRLLEWNQQRAHTYARKTSLGKDLLHAEDLPADLEVFPDDPDFVQLPRKLNPIDLPKFEEGAWYIQDPATRFAPRMLNPQPGEVLLDACAAPGGKTSILADLLYRKSGEIVAIDPQEYRVQRLQENMNRLQTQQVHVECATLNGFAGSTSRTFDGILLDVPCSNTGVLQRRPDAKWNLTEEGFAERAALQRTLLEEAVPLCKPGGRIVYSTCCIEPEETTEVIAAFLQDHSDWQKVEEQLILPGQHQTDGAYCCLLKRI